MPELHRERFPSTGLRSLLEEIVLAGCGVLLVFLGVFSSVPFTSIASVGIGALLFYTAFRSYRNRVGLFRPATVQKGDEREQSDREEYSGESDEESETERQETELFWNRRQQDLRQTDEGLRDQDDGSAAAGYEEPFEPVAAPPASRRAAERTGAPANTFRASRGSTSDIMSHSEPQNEFNTLVGKTLQIVKEVCFAHSVTFFWVKGETGQLVLEGRLSDADAFTHDRKIAMGNDAVSRIAATGEPQVVNNISPESERDLLCYYRALQDIRSFIGVPVFYAGDATQRPIAVLAADSKAADAYGDETFAMLTHVANLLSSMLISYTEKYDLFADVKLIEADTKLRSRIAGHPPVSTVVNAVSAELENVIPWESITMVLYDEAQHAWSVASVRVRGNDRFVSPKQLIDLDGSIVGQCIRTNTVQMVDLAHRNEVIFNDHERSSEVLKQGMMVVVPFSSGGKCYGAVAVSERKAHAYTKKEIAAIQYLAATAAPEFEITELSAILGEHLAVDELTGTMSRKYFMSRLSEELSRSTEREEDLSLVMLTLYNIAEIEQRYEDDGRDAALVHVARHLRASVRPYDIVGRYDRATFAVALADTIASDAYLWAEKLRTAIAGSIVSVGRKSFSTTVTIGISGASAKMSGEELVKNASHVLDLAKKAGGNIVRVF